VILCFGMINDSYVDVVLVAAAEKAEHKNHLLSINS